MNKFLLTLFCVLIVAPAILAQPNTRKEYLDSLQGIATAAGHLANETPGYGQYKALRGDIASYNDKMITVKFVKVTDSISIWGGHRNFGQDTTWTQLRIQPHQLAPTIGVWSATAGAVPMSQMDTSLIWLSPVTTNKMTFSVPLVDPVTKKDYIFPYYRVTLAPYDSGKVYIGDIRRGGY